MKYKGARIRHLEAQVARLEAELNEVKRTTIRSVPISPPPNYIGGGAIGITPQPDKRFLINEGIAPHPLNTSEKVG